MPEKPQEMPFLSNIGLLLTYRCQVTCPHCILEAGPHRTESMEPDDALEWIAQIAAYRNRRIGVLSLTGGEPFIDLDKLKTIAAAGDRSGLLVSAVTNAFWAETPAVAARILEDISSLCFLSISTDVHHLRSIPMDRVKNAVTAADQCGIPYTISICTENESDPAYQAVVSRVKEFADEDTILTAITFRAGRALANLGNCEYEMTQHPPIAACTAAASPIVFPDGRVIACIGPVVDLKCTHPLLLGDLRRESLADILDRSGINPVLHAIRIWGPRKLISLIREAGLERYLPDEYVKDSVCNACYALLAHKEIREYLEGLIRDKRFVEKVAYARVYYLEETDMAERLQLAALK